MAILRLELRLDMPPRLFFFLFKTCVARDFLARDLHAEFANGQPGLCSFCLVAFARSLRAVADLDGGPLPPTSHQRNADKALLVLLTSPT